MAKTGTQVLTANRLTDGAVLYWKAGQWTEALGDADILESKDAADAALDTAKRFVADRVVVNPYLFDVTIEDGVTVPVKEREIIRAMGPSVRRDLGKQVTKDLPPFAQREPHKSALADYHEAPTDPDGKTKPEAFDVSV